MNQGPILLVEDDRDIREILTESLVDEGFEVLTAENGLEALKVLRTAPVRPSVILLDLMMPVLDGYGFLEESEHDPSIASIPVAIVTAGSRVDRTRIGGAPVVSKPIDLPKLIDLLEGLQRPKRRLT